MGVIRIKNGIFFFHQKKSRIIGMMSLRAKNVLISWFWYFQSCFCPIAINHIGLIYFGVYHTQFSSLQYFRKVIFSTKVLISEFWACFWCKRIRFTSVRINIRCNQKKLLNLLQKRVFPRYWWFFCCLHTILIFANFPVRSQGQTKMCSSLDSDIFCLVFVPLL